MFPYTVKYTESESEIQIYTKHTQNTKTHFMETDIFRCVFEMFENIKKCFILPITSIIHTLIFLYLGFSNQIRTTFYPQPHTPQPHSRTHPQT